MRLRFVISRMLNFIRPKPRLVPMTVEQILVQSAAGRTLVDSFNDLFYASGVAGELSWRGIPLLKNPCDLWMILELIQRVRPRVIIETGTHYGGSATFFAEMASICELPCIVVTIDFNPKWNFDPRSKGIRSLVGYSTAPRILAQVSNIIREATTEVPGAVMVLLDSDHTEDHVLTELRLYSPFVTLGSYLIVEDTNVNGHPSFRDHGPGPFEAVQKFVAENKNFVIDYDCQRFLLTFNPSGWLRRIS